MKTLILWGMPWLMLQLVLTWHNYEDNDVVGCAMVQAVVNLWHIYEKISIVECAMSRAVVSLLMARL